MGEECYSVKPAATYMVTCIYHICFYCFKKEMAKMRKLITLIMACMMFCSIAAADTIDVTSMTIHDLQELQEQIGMELSQRVLKGQEVPKTEFTPSPGKKTLLIDDNDYKIYLTGKYNDSYGTFYAEAVCENYSGKALRAWMGDGNLDGWKLSFPVFFPEQKSGEKQKSSMIIQYTEAMMKSPSEMKTFIFTITTEDTEDEFGNVYKQYGPFTLHFEVGKWVKH